jgi:hypothetical protein
MSGAYNTKHFVEVNETAVSKILKKVRRYVYMYMAASASLLGLGTLTKTVVG